MPHHDEEKKLRLSKKRLAEIMKDLDFCMMTTVGPYGRLRSRPMSNNRDVEWDGDTWFFAFADSAQVQDVQRDASVNLAYARPDEILFVSVTGRGEIVRDDDKKTELWFDDLKRWFPEGAEDNKVVLIKVTGTHVALWSKEGDGELDL